MEEKKNTLISAPETPDADAPDAEEMAQEKGGVLSSLTTDKDVPPVPFTLKNFVGGDVFGGRWFRKNFLFMLFCAVLILFYVTNRYACQQQVLVREQLLDSLERTHYIVLTRSAILREKTLRSKIEDALEDSTLHVSTTPLFLLPHTDTTRTDELRQ